VSAFSLPNPLVSYGQQRADHPLLICDGKVWTAQQFSQTTSSVAAWLKQQGVDANAVVSLSGQATATWLQLFSALGHIGATIVPIHEKEPLAAKSEKEALAKVIYQATAKGDTLTLRNAKPNVNPKSRCLQSLIGVSLNAFGRWTSGG